ncbi:hypothetical protein BIW11_05417, partial [Tropilaelaps mercedesae]
LRPSARQTAIKLSQLSIGARGHASRAGGHPARFELRLAEHGQRAGAPGVILYACAHESTCSGRRAQWMTNTLTAKVLREVKYTIVCARVRQVYNSFWRNHFTKFNESCKQNYSVLFLSLQLSKAAELRPVPVQARKHQGIMEVRYMQYTPHLPGM